MTKILTHFNAAPWPDIETLCGHDGLAYLTRLVREVDCEQCRKMLETSTQRTDIPGLSD